MKHRALVIALIASVLATWLLLWVTTIPLGVPGEWTWPRIEGGADQWIGLVLAMTIGAVYVAFVVGGSHRIDDSSRTESTAWLLLLLACGFAWLWTVQECVSGPANLAKVPYVLFYPRSSGYYWQAWHDVESPTEFLRTYEALLAEQDYLHIGTHPPGLTLGYHWLLTLCMSSPRLTEVVLATCPSSATESLETISTLSANSGMPLSRGDVAALWLASLVTMLTAAGTLLGIYVLVRRHCTAGTAWIVAGLWPLVPAVAVFHPKSDTLFPCIAVTMSALWMKACDRRSRPLAIAAGLTLWVGMLLSLAFVTVGALLVAMTLWEWFVPSLRRISIADGEVQTPSSSRERLLLLALGACGMIVPSLVMGAMFDINVLNVWRWNLSNHALFYEHNTRTWSAWLLENPWEFALSVGLPVCVVAFNSLWQLKHGGQWAMGRASLAAAFVAVWGLLWFSGKNMGEAARLWVLLMPWVVMMTATSIERLRNGSADSCETVAPGWLPSPMTWLLVAQMVVCVLTVLRIDGFHFAEMMTSPDGE